jgi:hypothetical protein
MLSDKQKFKHYHRMLYLQHKHGMTGQLPKGEDSELKKLHAEHAAGLFDSIKEYFAKLIFNNHPVTQFLKSKFEQAKKPARLPY